MTDAPFTYARNARIGELLDLARDISPMETRGMAPGDVAALGGLFIALAARSRTYTARLGGRLCGVCFVEDFPDRRGMSVTKTRYLTEERRFAFARGIARLLRDLDRLEAAAGRCGVPMYMHTPEGDVRSKEWFIRAGCVETERGLLCPHNGKES